MLIASRSFNEKAYCSIYGYGGGSLEKILLQLRASGKIGITNEQIAILKGVASVETGGQVQSINTWDSAVVSFGFMQWILRYGEFQKLIEKAPGAFSEYGIEFLELKG